MAWVGVALVGSQASIKWQRFGKASMSTHQTLSSRRIPLTTVLEMPSKVDQNSIRRRGAGLIASDPDKVSPGYIVVAPLTSNQVRSGVPDVFPSSKLSMAVNSELTCNSFSCVQVHLVGTDGKTVHTWTFPWRNGRHARLLPNGNLAVNSIDPDVSLLQEP